MIIKDLKIKPTRLEQKVFSEEYFKQTLLTTLKSLVELDITLHYNGIEMVAEKYDEIKNSKKYYNTINFPRHHLNLLKVYHFDIACLSTILKTIAFENDYEISFNTNFGEYLFTLQDMVNKLNFLRDNFFELITKIRGKEKDIVESCYFVSNPSYYVIQAKKELFEVSKKVKK